MKSSDPSEQELRLHRLHRLADGHDDAVSSTDLSPEEQAEVESIRALTASLQEGLPAEIEPEHPEFFNSQLIRQIRREEAASESASSSAAASSASGFFRWFPWAAAAAACAVAVFLGARGPASSGTPLASAYAPAASVEVKTWYSEEAEATVIDLVGLESFPEDREITGQRVGSYEIQESEYAHRLVTPEGEPVLTLVSGPSGTPTFFAN